MTDLYLDALDLKEGHTVIDVGCGIGGSLRLGNARLRGSRLLGVNIDPRQLTICKSHQARNGNLFEWMQCDASDVPLDSQSADRILSLGAMFHFPSRQTFLAEAARLLCTKGFLVCSDILLGRPRTDQESRMLDVVRHGYAPWPQPLL